MFMASIQVLSYSGQKTARSVKQLMPVINGQYKIIKRSIEIKNQHAVPEKNIEKLKDLFEELKQSPSNLYTKDTLVWENYCAQMISALNDLESSWKENKIEDAKSAFEKITSTRDQAHESFDSK